MNLKGYTQIGLITGLAIFLFHMLLIKYDLQQSGFLGLQYMFLLTGIFISIYLYDRANKLVILDLFMIGIRTMSSALVVLILGAAILHFSRPEGEELFVTIGLFILTFGMSGALSSLVSAIIVNKLLKTT